MNRDTLDTLDALYGLHGAAIYRYVLGMLGDREDAEDAVQTIWLKLARARLDEVRDLPAYLWAAARHHAHTAGRRRSREREHLAADAELDMLPADANPGVPAAARRDVAQALARLKPRFREMAVLVGLEGLTLKEAAKRLGIPPGTAASRYRTALEKLRRALGDTP